jgi:hypothetical protein
MIYTSTQFAFSFFSSHMDFFLFFSSHMFHIWPLFFPYRISPNFCLRSSLFACAINHPYLSPHLLSWPLDICHHAHKWVFYSCFRFYMILVLFEQKCSIKYVFLSSIIKEVFYWIFLFLFKVSIIRFSLVVNYSTKWLLSRCII